jgi:hypothetical protein
MLNRMSKSPSFERHGSERITEVNYGADGFIPSI